MEDYFEEACDTLDAAVYTGDALSDDETRRRFKGYLRRWEIALNGWKDITQNLVKESNDESKNIRSDKV